MTIHAPTYPLRARIFVKPSRQFDRPRDWATSFRQTDTFEGVVTDPQSLHKYAYVHSDPLNNIDPTGEFALAMSLTSALGGAMLGYSGAGRAAKGWEAGKSALQGLFSNANVEAGFQNRTTFRQYPQDMMRKSLEYAHLAQLAYENQNFRAGTLGWTYEERLLIQRTGFHAVVFSKGSETVLAFAGTTFTSGSDWLANFGQAAFGRSSQYSEAIAYAESVIREYGPNVHLVGHSLGGGLASAAALSHGIRATTFNAAGLNPATIQVSLDRADELIDAWRVRGEILTTLQDASIPWWFKLPGALGTALDIFDLIDAATPSSVGKTHWLTDYSFSSPVNQHLMSTVIPSMEELIQSWYG